MAAVVTRRARGPRVGIALSATAVCAAIRRPGESRVQAWRASLAPLNGDGSAWPGLAEALRSLARDAGVTDGRLSVALMSPLAEARAVDLPALGVAETQMILARGAAKYFVAARGPQVVGSVRAPGGGDGTTVSLVAVAAGARLVHAINEAAADAGWTVETIIPAEAAWGAAAAQWAGRSRGRAQLLVAHADRTDFLSVENGTLAALRRFRTGADDAALIADAFSRNAGHLGVVGNADAQRELTRQLSARGVAVETPAGAATEIAEHPDLLAAAFAAPGVTPALVTDSVRIARAMSIRRVTSRIMAAAVLVVFVAGVLEWWGMRRELDSIKAQRVALAPQIQTTLVGKTTVEKAMGQLTVLAGEEHSSPHWSVAIAAVTDRLPTDAFLAGFRGRGDSLSLDGLAVNASRAFDAIEKVPALTNVHFSGPVHIEKATQDGPQLERFAVTAGLAGLSKPKAPAVKPKTTAPAQPATVKGAK